MDGLDRWIPTLTMIGGLLVFAWRAGGVARRLETLLAFLTEDVVEVKADVKQSAAQIHAQATKLAVLERVLMGHNSNGDGR